MTEIQPKIPMYPDFLIHDYEVKQFNRNTGEPEEPLIGIKLQTVIRKLDITDKKYYLWIVKHDYECSKELREFDKQQAIKQFIKECYMVIVLGNTHAARKMTDMHGQSLLYQDRDQKSEVERLKSLIPTTTKQKTEQLKLT